MTCRHAVDGFPNPPSAHPAFARAQVELYEAKRALHTASSQLAGGGQRASTVRMLLGRVVREVICDQVEQALHQRLAPPPP